MEKKILNRLMLSLSAVIIFSAVSNSEIVMLSRNLTEKHLPSSAVSMKSGTKDGMLACWYDEIDNGSLYVQKIGINGIHYWNIGGKQVDINLGQTYSEDESFPEIFSDGEGGAALIYRKKINEKEEIYFVRILADGRLLAKPVCLSSEFAGYNYSHKSVKCDDNTIITAWENFNDGDFDIQAQKTNMNGKKLWNKGRELTVCGEPSDQRRPTILCSRDHVYFSWLDSRTNPEEYGLSLYTNKIDLNGSYTDFKDKGKLIFLYDPTDGAGETGSEKMFFYNHNMVLSERNSFITAIEKHKSDIDSYVKIIKVDESLNVTWNYDIDDQSFQSMPLITSDGKYGAFVFWVDGRNENSSVYGIRISPAGGVITGSKNGTDLSWSSEKNSFMKELPSPSLISGTAMDMNTLVLPWTSREEGRLLHTTIDLRLNPVFKQSNEVINENSSGGRYASVVFVDGNIFTVFKIDDNIYADINSYQNLPDEMKTGEINSYCFPNPFNPSSKIKYHVPLSAHVKIRVFNQAGQMVTELVNDDMEAGNYETEFNASRYASGFSFPSGAYFYRIEIVPNEHFGKVMTETGRMLLIK